MLGILLLVPTVAVMPFRDLSGGRGAVGEAIRETVTADLKELGTLKVLERAAIDQVIREQKLEEKRNDLDPLSSVRVGTLLGATLLVAGAYQKSGEQVRLTARFVDVASGEIRGSAKVDGRAGDFFALEDRVTGELARSAGLAPPKPKKRRALKSWHAIELYGDAVVEPDAKKRQKILHQALDEDPDFVYAARDLAELDAKMSGWSKTADVKLAEREKELLAKVRAGKAPAADLYQLLFAARRFHALAQVAATLGGEEGAFRLFQARDRLHRSDLALQDGEIYLSKHPGGPHFREVETRMHEIVEARRTRDARRAEYKSDLDEKLQRATGVERDWAPCIAARWNSQLNELMLDGCRAYLARRANEPDKDAQEHAQAARFFVVLALDARGDFEEARPIADKLLATPNEWHEDLRKLMADWPTD